MAKIPETGPVTIAEIAAEWQGPEDLAELSKKSPLLKSGTEEVSVDDFRGEYYYWGTEAVGGDITTDGEYRYHTFSTPGTFEITKGGFGDEYDTVEVIIIGGGGGCGCPTGTYANGCALGGAGAGGVVTAAFASEILTKTVSSIGAGGPSEPSNYQASGRKGGNTEVVGYTVAAGGAAGTKGSITAAQDGACSAGINSGGGNSVQGRACVPTGQGNRGGAGNANGIPTAGGGGGGGGAGGGQGTNAGGNGGAGKLWHGVRYSGGGGGGGVPQGGGLCGRGGSGGGGTAATIADGLVKDPGAPTDFWGGGAGASGIKSNGDGTYTVGPVYSGYQGAAIFRYKIIPDVTKAAEPVDRTFAPAMEPQPDYDSSTHKAVLNMIENPRQKTVGWTIVELTAEEKAAYAEAMEAMDE